MVWLAKLLGWILARVPEPVVSGIVKGAAWIIVRLPIERCHELKSNIHHAFPDKDSDWRDQLATRTTARLVEMAFFALASPFLSKRWFERHLEITPEVRERLLGSRQSGAIVLLPHVTLFEMMAAIPAVFPEGAGSAAAFRPLKQGGMDAYVKRTRERWGIRLLSRRDGMRSMARCVREGKSLTLLFDQNTGKRGVLFYFLHRVASGTHLPGLLCKKFEVPAFFLLPRRTGFWKASIDFEPLPSPGDPSDLLFASHRRLERYLTGSLDQAADWLWFHNRWGTHDKPRNRFFLRERDNALDASAAFHAYKTRPRRTRLWFRLPNWLGDVVMALPLIRAVRHGRPDAEITLLGQAAFRPLLEHIGFGDRLIDLPNRDSQWRYFAEMRSLRGDYPDAYLCFTNSFRGDLEAWLTRAPRRFGMVRPGKRRPLLTDPWKVPTDLDESQCHQVDVWEAMFRYYGLREPLHKEPFRKHVGGDGIGLICGTENMPEKRWPVAHWRGFIERVLEHSDDTISLYGTARDRAITDQVAAGFDSHRVRNRAGETNLSEYLEALCRNRAVVCNDTGGMHLANLLGVPVYAIFGPTNPVRTGPVYEAETHLLQPPGCPPEGGLPIDEVTVDHLWEAWS